MFYEGPLLHSTEITFKYFIPPLTREGRGMQEFVNSHKDRNLSVRIANRAEVVLVCGSQVRIGSLHLLT